MYSRQLNGQTLTLAPSGWTYNRTFVLYDKETESLWYPFPDTGGLTAISGPHKDLFLPLLESTPTTWDKWHAEHPESKYMRYPYRAGNRW